MLAMNLAIDLQNRGRSPVVVDADHANQTAQLWARDRNSRELPPIPVYQGEGNLDGTLRNLSKTHSDVILDVRGGDSREMRTGLGASDFLIVPTTGHQNDLDSLEPLRKVAERAADFNKDLTVVVVLTKVQAQGARYEIEDARTFLQDFPEFEVADSVFTAAKVWTRARTEGKGVVEVEGKAKNMMRLFTSELLTAMGEE